ncbi:MAG: MFS transporter, partial [Thermoplasmata archaeon]
AYALLLLAAALVTIPLSLRLETSTTEAFWASFRKGWASFQGRAARPLRQFLGVESIYGFFVAVPPLLITAIAYEWFGDPASAYSILVTLYVVGGAIGGVIVGHYNPRRSVGVLLIVAPLVIGIAMLLLLAAPVELVALGALLALADAFISIRYTAKYSWVRATFDPEELGRAVANIYFFTGVSSSVAALTIGVLSTAIGLDGVIVVAGGGLLVAAAVAAAVPFIRTMRY